MFIQDSWQPHTRVTLDLGVRYDLWTGFDLDQRSNPIWQVLSTQTRFNEIGQLLPPNQLSGLASDPPNEVASPTLRTPHARGDHGERARRRG